MGALAVLWLLKVVDVSTQFPAAALKVWGLIHHSLGRGGCVRLGGSDRDPDNRQLGLALPSSSPELGIPTPSLNPIPSPKSTLFSDLVLTNQKPIPSEPTGFHPPRPSFWSPAPSFPTFQSRP